MYNIKIINLKDKYSSRVFQYYLIKNNLLFLLCFYNDYAVQKLIQEEVLGRICFHLNWDAIINGG